MKLIRASIVAPSGSGKSTLVAGLLRMGYAVRYHAFEDARDVIENFVEPELLTPDRWQYSEYNDSIHNEMETYNKKDDYGNTKQVSRVVLTAASEEALAYVKYMRAYKSRATDTVKPSPHTWVVFDSLSSIIVAMINWFQYSSGFGRYESRGGATGVFETFVTSYFSTENVGANILLLGHVEEKGVDYVLSGVPGKAMPRNFSRYNNRVLGMEKTPEGYSLLTSAPPPFSFLKCPEVGRVDAVIPATLVNADGERYTSGGSAPGPFYVADGLIRYMRAALPENELPPIPECLRAPLVTNAIGSAVYTPAFAAPTPAPQAEKKMTLWDKM